MTVEELKIQSLKLALKLIIPSRHPLIINTDLLPKQSEEEVEKIIYNMMNNNISFIEADKIEDTDILIKKAEKIFKWIINEQDKTTQKG